MEQPFKLPQALEARRPPEARGLARDGVSLLVTDAATGLHTATAFTTLAAHLRAGDLLVVNDSATIPAALTAHRQNNTAITVHLSTRISESTWIVEPRNAKLVEAGETLALPAGGELTLIAPLHPAHARLWYASISLPLHQQAYLAKHARPISYSYLDASYPIETYQTIFARNPGSVEMPSAGRPFTLRVLDSLYRSNVNIASITLHCGVSSPETHEPPLDERFTVPKWTAEAINTTRARKNRIIAVGTTAVRAIESATAPDGTVHAASGWTNHLVDAAHPPRAVDAILTGFHEPQASHLQMLEAFISPHLLSHAYETAIENNYLWHEFGDVHLLLRTPLDYARGPSTSSG